MSDLSHPAWVCGLKLAQMHPTQSTVMSHPAWVCGLKPELVENHPCYQESHPAWVCGLKLASQDILLLLIGHTLRGCVD